MLFIKQSILVFLSLLAFSCKGQDSSKNHTQLSAKEFKKALDAHDNHQLIDVRTPNEFKEGHIKGAININWHDPVFEKQITTLNKNEIVYIYCRSGGRSASAAEKMITMGFTNIQELDNGITEWEDNKFPIQK